MGRRRGAALPDAAAIAAATPCGDAGSREEGLLSALPADVLLLVARHWGGWELSLAACVCAAWRRALCGAAPLWRAALERDFADGNAALAIPAGGRSLRVALRDDLRLDDTNVARALEWVRCPLRKRSWVHGGGSVRRESAEEDEDEDFQQRSWRLFPSAWARHRAAGGPPQLLAAQAAARAAGVTPHQWRAVRVVERPTRWPDARALMAWADDVCKPYAMQWLPHPARQALASAPRRVRLLAPLCAPDSALGEYHLYRQLAAALLSGRCRVCNCRTERRHPVLGVPMCAELRCAGAFPVLPAARAAALLGAASGGGAARAAADAGVPVGVRRRRPRRPRRAAATKETLLLVSSVARLAAQRNHAGARAAAAAGGAG
jgi:hypothetical protein